MAARIFSLLANHNISVDMIIQSQRCHQINGILTRDIAFTVAQGDADESQQILEQAVSELGCGEIVVNKSIAKLSMVGSGMLNHPGVAAKMFEALANKNINISMIATSEIKVSCLVDEDQGIEALKAVHEVFELSGERTFIVPERAPVA
jgi:aspartate kinase